jgi:hypothetical protein
VTKNTSLKTKLISAMPDFLINLYRNIKAVYKSTFIDQSVSIKDYSQESVQAAIEVLKNDWKTIPDLIFSGSTHFFHIENCQLLSLTQLTDISKGSFHELLILDATRFNKQSWENLLAIRKAGGVLVHISELKLYSEIIRRKPELNNIFDQRFPIIPSKDIVVADPLSITKAPVDESDVYNFRILFRKFNLLFYEVPKNASSTTKTVLFSIANESKVNLDYKQYMSFSKWRSEFPSMQSTWDDIVYTPSLKFAFLRNPYERLASGYYNTGWKFVNQNITFEEFLESIPEKLESPPSDMINIHYQPFTYFIPKIDGKLYIDFVGKVENFAEDIKLVLNSANIFGNFQTPKINKSDNHNYRELYSTRSKKIVQSLYEEEIELGKYIF